VTRDREDVAYWHFSEVPPATRELDLADEHRLGPMLILRRGGARRRRRGVRPTEAARRREEARSAYILLLLDCCLGNTERVIVAARRETSKMPENATQGLDTDAEQERRERREFLRRCGRFAVVTPPR
jgi:hypothetical protein